MAAALSKGGAHGTEVFVAGRKAVITDAETNRISLQPGKVGHVVVWDVGTGAALAVYDTANDTEENQCWGWDTAQGIGTFALQMPMQNGIRIVTTGTFGGVTVVYD